MRLVVMLVVAAVVGFAGAAAVTAATEDPVIHIDAMKFEFIPPSVTLKKGQRVVLELSSLDRTHGFKIPDLGVGSQVIKAGEITRVTVTPEKVGEFTFLCDNFCGDGHEDMNGTIVVKE
jgi:cytochrome c oxidase subunit 2